MRLTSVEKLVILFLYFLSRAGVWLYLNVLLAYLFSMSLTGSYTEDEPTNACVIKSNDN